MQFKKYQHIERYGSPEVEGIELGMCYVFPKIDGTNGSIWLDNEGKIKAGSRNRELTLEKDNAGFYAYVLENDKFEKYLQKHPTHRLYGEFLIPHTLKIYRDNAWRKFYVFDVCIDKEDESVEYIPYEIYKKLLEEFNIDYIPPLAKIKNATYEDFVKLLGKNNFLIKDGKGIGEGIVIKNYDFYNKFKRQIWAKIITSEFKEKHYKTMGCPVITKTIIEEKIIEDFCTSAFIEKEYAKIINENGKWENKFIPILFERVYYELIKEETCNIIKKFTNPIINYKTLYALTIKKIKEVKSEIFS